VKRLAALVLAWSGACSGPAPDGGAVADLPSAGGDDGGFGGTSESGANHGIVDGEGGTNMAAGAPGSTLRPFVTEANPRLDERDVYPTPLWNGNGEEAVIEVSFSAPMTQTQDYSLEASDHVRPLEATWSADATRLTLVARPDFAFARPLADTTEYALDLSALVSNDGALLEPNRALRDGRLVFTTSRHDALLNHSCGHTFFGPFASVGSGQAADETAPDIGTTHTQYAVTLNRDKNAYGGWVRANLAMPGQYRLYFDGLVELLVTGTATVTADAFEPTTTPRACPGITYETTIEPQVGEEVFLQLGASADPIRRVIVELVPDDSAASR
jgi:hypothetical protein